MTDKKNTPSWSGVKASLADFDRDGLIGLIQDLYAVGKDNQAFLHARFALGDDVLRPYKLAIDRWLWPDAFKNENPSVVKAKKAISDYRKALGRPEGLAELMVFFCERAAGYCADIGFQDEGFFDALTRMFERALTAVEGLPEGRRPELIARLEAVRRLGGGFGYGVDAGMDDALAKHGIAPPQ